MKFDSALRKETEEAARRLHELIASGITPKAEYSKNASVVRWLTSACRR